MEAGLRAWDRRMPEQRNRILIDHISNILLPYNGYHRETFREESTHLKSLLLVIQHLKQCGICTNIGKSDILTRLKIEPKKYILVTAHRSSVLTIQLPFNYF